MKVMLRLLIWVTGWFPEHGRGRAGGWECRSGEGGGDGREKGMGCSRPGRSALTRVPCVATEFLWSMN